jgi:FtsP/CotA-like multicopper oxidase with cupredoxin domain
VFAGGNDSLTAFHFRPRSRWRNWQVPGVAAGLATAHIWAGGAGAILQGDFKMNQTIGRRGVLTGLAASAVVTGLGAGVPPSRGAEAPRLRAVTRTIEVKGRAAKVFGLLGPDGRPGMEFVFGENFRARLENLTGTETLIHWHGLTPPSEQDGVPMLSQAVLPTGSVQTYDFANTRSGTHWMHSHVGLQEQSLLAAPLIVRETREPIFDEQEHVVMVHDFTFRDPAEILSELRGGGGAHAGHGNMPGMGAMLNDVVFDAYLCNDRTLDDPEIVAVETGGQIRLRIINAAAASNLWIDLGSLQGDLIAVDGNAVHPVRGSLFPLAIAQRADIRVRMPEGGGAFPVLFQPEGVVTRTGLVLASPGSPVAKIAAEAAPAPAVDLAFEQHLRAAGTLPDEPVTRTEMLMLTGGGADYVWGLNGRASMHDTLFTVRPGERIEVIIHNMTGMAHPMHLHGHYFQVAGIGATRIEGALRDTVLVPPKATVTIRFDANNPGTWAFHCHHIYHMNSGMMGTVGYTQAA